MVADGVLNYKVKKIQNLTKRILTGMFLTIRKSAEQMHSSRDRGKASQQDSRQVCLRDNTSKVRHPCIKRSAAHFTFGANSAKAGASGLLHIVSLRETEDGLNGPSDS